MKYKYDHDCPFEAYITNLGKYNEGYLIGEWVKFPASEQDLEAVMKRIGIGSCDEFGCPYEEFFITDYDIYVDGLSFLGEFTSLDTLNRLASLIEDSCDLDKVQAVFQLESPCSAEEAFELLEDLDDYYFYPDVMNDYDLGYYWVEESGCYDLDRLGELSRYIDYESYGRDCSFNGAYTDYGFVERG